MFDIQKRQSFQTVGELRALLNRLPASTTVCICGDINCFYHEEQDGSLISFDCEDLRDHYNEALEKMLEAEPPEERIVHLESLRKELAEMLVDPKTGCIADMFHCFPAGTHQAEIGRWIDEICLTIGAVSSTRQ